METIFAIGDVVKLKSGGLLMTVALSDKDSTKVVFTERNKQIEKDYATSLLEKADPDEGKPIVITGMTIT